MFPQTHHPRQEVFKIDTESFSQPQQAQPAMVAASSARQLKQLEVTDPVRSPVAEEVPFDVGLQESIIYSPKKEPVIV